MMNPRKVAVIGCGLLGSSIAFSLMQKGIYSELVLIDANHAKAEGEALDLSHGLPYTRLWIYMQEIIRMLLTVPDHYYSGGEPEARRNTA